MRSRFETRSGRTDACPAAAGKEPPYRGAAGRCACVCLRSRRRSRPIVLLLAAAACALAADPPGKIKTLILSGANNHDWRATTPRLREILDRSGRFDVRVTEEPAALTAAILASYQLIVLDYNGPR